MTKHVLTILAVVFAAVTAVWAGPAGPARTDIDVYIRKAWTTLRRSVASCDAYRDTKVGSKPTLYLPAGMAVPPEVAHLQKDCGVTIAHLPRPIQHLGDVDVRELPAQGLLYLPHPYVVPGGMFNEMYGWDSYFIIRGLLEDGQVEMARGMCENWFFEIEHYGAILNANRTYYLTRSQPPFLTSAIRAIYEKTHDVTWLKRAYSYAGRDHRMWCNPPFVATNTGGLSRYFDVGAGPIPEMGAHENYYQQVAAFVMSHAASPRYVDAGDGAVILHPYAPTDKFPHTAWNGRPVQFIEVPAFTFTVCEGQVCSQPAKVHLTEDYYKGDRAMRASGFDVSFRFGPFSGLTHHYAPVCLNSLLYKSERDLAEFAKILGRSEEARRYETAAAERGRNMRKYLWNEQAGWFVDYDFQEATKSTYNYATAYYPLWAGLATPDEARRIQHSLIAFEKPHGLAMSTTESGAQWDLPFGWAPVHLLAVEGLTRYGMREDALRLARKWNDTVRVNYLRDGTIHEKYDVVTGSSDTKINVGYSENVVGFGWTNAVYRVFERLLRKP